MASFSKVVSNKVQGLGDYARILLHAPQFHWVFAVYQTVVGGCRSALRAGLYRVAVSLSIPWPAACIWHIGKLAERLSNNIESNAYNAAYAAKLDAEASFRLDALEHFAPNMQATAELRAAFALWAGRTREWLATQYKIFEIQENRARLADAGNQNIRILEPYFHILIGIGSTVHLDAYIKAGILGLRPPSRTVVLHEPWLRRYAVNPCMLDYWRKFIDIVEDPAELQSLRPMRKSLAFNVTGPIQCGAKIIPWGHSAAVYVQERWDSQMRNPLLCLTVEHRGRGMEALKTIGLPEDAWFVALHVREGKFGTHRMAEPYRDADPTTYSEAITAITSRGGWVVRLGDSSMSSLPKMNRLFDYAKSELKSDWMDVFLCAAARFMIGCSSGPATVSRAFGIPIAMTNYLPSAALYLSKHDVFLPKMLRRRASGSMVSFEQQMSLPLSACVSDGMFANLYGVEVISNSAQEIQELVEEMMDKLDGRPGKNAEDDNLQKRFKRMTAERETLPGLPGFELQCSLGHKFLSRYQSLLPTI